MDLNCIGAESKPEIFRKYLETSGVTEKLTSALLKLYQEEPRPQDSIEFIKKHLFGNLPTLDEVKKLRDEIKKLKRDISKYEDNKRLSQVVVKKTDSEIESLLNKLFLDFNADDTGNSLLKKHLTEDLFEDLLELRTDQKGSLLDNIISGLTHYDSEIGIFASDQNAYEIFGELFKAVLEELHDTEGEVEENGNVTTVSASQPAVDWGNIDEVKNLDSEGFFIKSVSITIGRAIDGIPFTPLITIDQLQEVMKNVRKILTDIQEEELKGNFFELADIDDEQKSEWIEEGILFPENTDKFLEAAGTYRLWPIGRGLFLNDQNNFCAWINEEEHLQVKTFDKNGNFNEVYKRLVSVTEKFGQLKFARDNRWGFLAHNLKNIGNTMRIAVKAKLPQMMKDENKQNLEILCAGNKITYRDLGDGYMQLTNSKLMGISEIDTIKAFIKGIEELITAEKCAYA